MRTFGVKNFDQFQHYKDRTPPWIKLYNALLDDYEFGFLPDASKWHLVAIWLLASRSGNRIPLDSRWVAKRINATEEIDLDLLFKSGFLFEYRELQGGEQDASKLLDLARSREESRGEEIPYHEGSQHLRVGTDADDDFNPVTGELRVVK